MAIGNEELSEEWKNSRSGAWAARGFDFQHLITVLILVRQWAGLHPSGNCIPEGLDDCVIELADRELWIQIKSKHSGLFSSSKVREYRETLRTKIDESEIGESVSCSIILEQGCKDVEVCELKGLFSAIDGSVIVCGMPEIQIIDTIQKQLNVADVIAEGILNDLYRLVADVATKNAALSFNERRKISSSEIDRKITLRVEAEDSSLIDEALRSGVLEAADFSTEVHDVDFYRGVKSKLGHVVSGQITERPRECSRIIDLLKQSRQLILTGPSGAGKSALLWLVATEISSWGRWFEVKPNASVTDANTIIRFIRSRQPKTGSPILIAMDEIGTHNSELWGILSNQLRGLSDVYLVGTTRIEDFPLIPNQSMFRTFPVALSEELAQSLWQKFHSSESTSWEHWREPFEMSEGLLLEYTHILTQGERLASIIDDQIRQREREKRHDELSIIRICSVICAYGGEVSVDKLLHSLNVPLNRGRTALTRLLDEHLVRESRAGVIGGLHLIRSKALKYASHDEVVYQINNSLLKSMSCITSESRPRVVQLCLAEKEEKEAAAIIEGLSKVLESANDSETWITILTGLGLATLERNVSAFMEILENVGLERAFWSSASMFSDPQMEVPDIPNQDNFSKVAKAIREFRSLSMPDLRSVCLERLPDNSLWPKCQCIRETNEMLASLLPITGSSAIDSRKIRLRYKLGDPNEQSIEDIACLLSSALLMNREIAFEMFDQYGGEEHLFSIFDVQTPWATRPVIETNTDGERIVRSDWYLISEKHQPDPHQSICDICEILIGISLESDFSASDAIDAKGGIIKIGDFSPWGKRMPRRSNPAKARVAWNVAFGELVIVRANTMSLTQYAHQISDHIRIAQEILLHITEDWIRGNKMNCSNDLVEKINETLKAVRSISYAEISPTPTNVSTPASQRSSEAKLGPFVTDVLENLLLRVVKASTGEGAKATATFAGKLHSEALIYIESEIWRVAGAPPHRELKELAARLKALSHILHELDYDTSPKRLSPLTKLAKKAPKGKGIYAASKRCKIRAEKRLEQTIRKVKRRLQANGWNSDDLIRDNERTDSPYWPTCEIAILVELPNTQAEEQDWSECLSFCNEEISRSWPFSIVPVVNHRVASSMALVPSESSPLGFLPDTNFDSKWEGLNEHKFASTTVSKCFKSIVASCIEISSLISCHDFEDLHPNEEEVISQMAESLQNGTDQLIEYAEEGQLDGCPNALTFIRDIRESINLELKGQIENSRLCDQLEDVESECHQSYAQLVEELLLMECFSSRPQEN